MKFQKEQKFPQNKATAEFFKFSVTRLSDSKIAYRDTKPRRGSKWWGYDFLVWDNKNNCRAAK